jgi:hypothetical protein
MKLTKLTADLAVIAKLPDSPTETAASLKAKFDQGPRAIGDYLNKTLLPELDEVATAVEEAVALIDGKQDKITVGTSAPAGGADGDIYIWY